MPTGDTPYYITYQARLFIDDFVVVESATTVWANSAISELLGAFNALAEQWGGGLQRWSTSGWGEAIVTSSSESDENCKASSSGSGEEREISASGLGEAPEASSPGSSEDFKASSTD
jgi:hypothetical protein